MKYIITESQNNWLKRRLSEIDDYVRLALSRVPAGGYNYHDYVEEIAWQVADEFGDLDQSELEVILDFVRENYWQVIEKHYLNGQDNVEIVKEHKQSSLVHLISIFLDEMSHLKGVCHVGALIREDGDILLDVNIKKEAFIVFGGGQTVGKIRQYYTDKVSSYFGLPVHVRFEIAKC